MQIAVPSPSKPYRGLAMEGVIAAWYAKSTAKNIDDFRNLANRLAQELKPQDCVLELAPGPGYLAIELAKLGPFRITGLDISRTFVRIAREQASRNQVQVDFQEGDAAHMPFPDEAFDFIVCRAAFKNFSNPIGALREMHRVLRPRGTALVIDMRNDATGKSIAEEVAKMNLGQIDGFITRVTLSALRKQAYSKQDFERMAKAAAFRACDIDVQPLALEVKLVR